MNRNHVLPEPMLPQQVFSWKDHKKQFLIYRAKTNYIYIHMKESNPINAAFRYSLTLQEIKGSTRYESLISKMEEYLSDLMRLTRNSTEVSTILTQNIDENKILLTDECPFPVININ